MVSCSPCLEEEDSWQVRGSVQVGLEPRRQATPREVALRECLRRQLKKKLHRGTSGDTVQSEQRA